MLLNEGLDTGDILLQKEIAIRPEDTALTYAPRLAELGADMVVETLRGLEDKTVHRSRRTMQKPRSLRFSKKKMVLSISPAPPRKFIIACVAFSPGPERTRSFAARA